MQIPPHHPNSKHPAQQPKTLLRPRLLLILLTSLIIITATFLTLHLLYPLHVNVTWSPVITASDGTVLHAFLSKDDKWRMKAELYEISPVLQKAVLLKEDQYFYYHPGINPVALGRALLNNAVQGKTTSGASTITMQVARLLDPRTDVRQQTGGDFPGAATGMVFQQSRDPAVLPEPGALRQQYRRGEIGGAALFSATAQLPQPGPDRYAGHYPQPPDFAGFRQEQRGHFKGSEPLAAVFPSRKVCFRRRKLKMRWQEPLLPMRHAAPQVCTAFFLPFAPAVSATARSSAPI